MVFRMKERLAKRFEEEVQFFKGWQKDKKGVGAVIPTSIHTARRMASVINPGSGLPVLELGAGTGVITKAILARGIAPSRLVSVEYSKDFYNSLIQRFPGVDFRLGDAFQLNQVLGDRRSEQFDCVVSAVPLLNFPMNLRVLLIEDLLARIPPGRPVIQITYGPLSPVVKMPDRYVVSHYDFVVRNIPPAQLWTYRRCS
ncbi:MULTISPECIES: phospholipid N-methyltransferase PmtA [Rhizobium]|uniref:Phosphatidylethanolamine/phosphatidyl-N-methylethanolamine N-methyltransferase n=1 Tax=Rhizobium binae TaxID=1138190 RepID=A0ABV2MKW9_9HYPH|nr:MULTISPECIES: class I SAM-dependent methyltransferase [Rhizobium]NKL49593.1 methyltransferase domain-containing protein [Rhizobium leguminosarum bv. viciae]MBX4937065.1 methyltransferase domain-containing protein [Rhizobium binae]MBX4943715.1 methyltransferase domain-containing protein [Rhizobium binae]MBX4979159.1 methyltransferase domain-containing protein [Rhizobium binae]MBX4995896.1 methyltransferase domain-containing protein [Rhizobium binae]